MARDSKGKIPKFNVLPKKITFFLSSPSFDRMRGIKTGKCLAGGRFFLLILLLITLRPLLNLFVPFVSHSNLAIPLPIPQESLVLAEHAAPYRRQTVICRGLAVASAYFEVAIDGVKIHMSTGHEPWKSYTPFPARSVRCAVSLNIGNHLETYKHYSSCSVPFESALKAVQKLAFNIVDTDNSTVCSVEAYLLKTRQNSAPHLLSALTTVQNSASYYT